MAHLASDVRTTWLDVPRPDHLASPRQAAQAAAGWAAAQYSRAGWLNLEAAPEQWVKPLRTGSWIRAEGSGLLFGLPPVMAELDVPAGALPSVVRIAAVGGREALPACVEYDGVVLGVELLGARERRGRIRVQRLN